MTPRDLGRNIPPTRRTRGPYSLCTGHSLSRAWNRARGSPGRAGGGRGAASCWRPAEPRSGPRPPSTPRPGPAPPRGFPGRRGVPRGDAVPGRDQQLRARLRVGSSPRGRQGRGRPTLAKVPRAGIVPEGSRGARARGAGRTRRAAGQVSTPGPSEVPEGRGAAGARGGPGTRGPQAPARSPDAVSGPGAALQRPFCRTPQPSRPPAPPGAPQAGLPAARVPPPLPRRGNSRVSPAPERAAGWSARRPQAPPEAQEAGHAGSPREPIPDGGAARAGP